MNTPYALDPERSKELLAEAGYAEGFPVTLDCPNDRYVNDEAICTAVVPMLQRIGIDVTLNAQTKSLHFNKIGQAEDNNTSFYMLGWTPGTFDAHNALQNLMTLDGEGQGTWNSGRYHNARVEELTDQIAVTVDEDERNALIREAFQIHKDEVGHIPLHQQALAWGINKGTVEFGRPAAVQRRRPAHRRAEVSRPLRRSGRRRPPGAHPLSASCDGRLRPPAAGPGDPGDAGGRR